MDLERQRARAEEAYYADAMSVEEFRGEQRRIGREQEAAERIMRQCQLERQDLEDAVEEALLLLGDAYELYRQAPPAVRRLLNQAVWTRLRVHERTVGGDLAEPFALLTAPLTLQDEDQDCDNVAEADGADEAAVSTEVEGTKMNRAPFPGRGSNINYLVAGTGFEPATSGL